MESRFNAVVKKAEDSDFISRYEDALPWCDCPSSAAERRRDYQQRLVDLKNATGGRPRKKECCKRAVPCCCR
jgi:hypothetical protein